MLLKQSLIEHCCDLIESVTGRFGSLGKFFQLLACLGADFVGPAYFLLDPSHIVSGVFQFALGFLEIFPHLFLLLVDRLVSK